MTYSQFKQSNMQERLLNSGDQQQALLSSLYPYILKKQIKIKQRLKGLSLEGYLERSKALVRCWPKDRKKKSSKTMPNIEISKVKFTKRLFLMNLMEIIFFSSIASMILSTKRILPDYAFIISFYVLFFSFVLLQAFYCYLENLWKKNSSVTTVKDLQDQFFMKNNQIPSRQQLKITYIAIEYTPVLGSGADLQQIKSSQKLTGLIVDYVYSPQWINAIRGSRKRHLSISHEYRIIIMEERELEQIKRQIKNSVMEIISEIENSHLNSSHSIIFQPQFSDKISPLTPVHIITKEESYFQLFIWFMAKLLHVNSFYLRWKFCQVDVFKVIHEFKLRRTTAT